jgi:extracellular elastinolytic metalloproteinase
MRRVCVRPRHSRAIKLLLPAALALLALALTPSSFGIVNLDDGTTDQMTDFDARGATAPTADQVAASSSIHGKVSWSRFGTPEQVFHRGGYLATGVRAPNAAAAALSWLAVHKTAFGLRSVKHLRLMTAEAMRGAPNFHAVSFRQAFGGALSADGVVTVAVVKARGGAWKVIYASSSLTPDARLTGKQKLSPLSAWLRAARATGIHINAADAGVLGKTADGALAISALGVSGAETVKPIAFGTPRHGALRAWDTIVTKSLQGNQNQYRVIVDAATGKLLMRQSQTFNLADNPTWKAFQMAPPYNPINAYPWNYPSTDTREVFCWTATAGCTNVVGDDPATNTYPGGIASKVPWDVQLDVTGANLGTTQTEGNNVDDARVWSGSHGVYGNPALLRASSATRDYQPAWTNAWYTSQCDPNQVNAAINPTGNDIEASTASMFVGHNRMHDFSYYLGFDEGHWNSQQYNHGVTTNDPTPTPGGPTIAAPLANDGLIGNAQSGAATGSRDNANMSTGADGTHATTNQFVWQPLAGSFYAPCVDGAYDFTVYGHEFGHMIENRMIAKGVGTRQGTHAGSMGEAFGDFDALEAVNELHVAPVAGSDRYTEGAYATGNGYNGIRDFLAGRPMGGQYPVPSQNPDTDPLNYGNFGFDIVGTEVHADGEIWVAVEIDLRELFLLRYPSSGTAEDLACFHGRQSSNTCPGDRRWIQDYYDSMVIMPRGPTMIDARDAMLAADLGRFGGANQDLIWQGFAMRGFGNTSNTVSNGDANPVPAFDAPASSGINNATINFTVDSKEGSSVPVNAQIFVGDYSARSTQIADTNPATVNAGTNATSNLDSVVPIVPNGAGSLAGGTADANNRWNYYNFVAVAPGYGHVRFRVKNLQPGEVRNITIHMPTNYASAAQGATITTDAPATGTNVTPANLIDDNEGTSNTQSCTPTATCLVPVNGRWVVIALGGIPARGIEVNRLGVSAMFSSRFVGLRSFDAYVCRAGKVAANMTCDGSIDAGWTKVITGAADSFPGVNPRPGTQDESLRYFNASPQPLATHVKFVVTNNQCTGQPSFQGDQDLDPANNAECRTGIRRSEVHTAEIEVFAQKATADGTLVSTG